MKGLRSHLRRKKSNKVKRQFSSTIPVSSADVPRLKKLLPK